MTKQQWALALMLAVAACGRKDTAGPPASEANLAQAVKGDVPPPAEPARPTPGQRDGSGFIAYRYELGFELPAARIDAVQRAHREACEAMTAARCQLLNAARTGGDSDAAEARLDLRIVPSEVRAFEARVTSTTANAGGALLTSSVTGEDITREVIDANAALKAKRTLRDRLQTLLERREGRLADLLAVEKALSETQQELDTATAELSELQQRISFSRLAISYRSTRPFGSTARPLAEAAANAGQTLSASLAVLLTTGVAILPWLVPVGAVVWLVGRLRARRARRRD